MERGEFYDPRQILEEVRARVEETIQRNEHIDYLAFVPDGEPTLDAKLGRAIELLRTLHVKTAVSSNATLIKHSEVRSELMTETMLAQGVNDGTKNLEAVAEFLVRLQPDRAYLSIPTRPPAE